MTNLLFLDFDGVLHPKGCDPSIYLVHLPRFEEVVREHPSVCVVISSTWQDAYSIRALRRKFAPDIADRIIGGTRGADPDGEAGSRHQQIKMYLRHIGATHVPWLALDDAAHEFPDDCVQLVLCDSANGFDGQAAGTLREALAGLYGIESSSSNRSAISPKQRPPAPQPQLR